nr:LEA type 2 family protein [Motiliproteus sediminis]
MSGCAALQPPEPPRVSIQQVRWAPLEGSPRFEFALEVLNPNGRELALDGVVYTLFIDDVELLQGATSQLPVIAAYSSEVITLSASPNLINGLRLLGRLAMAQRQSVPYRLEARIDPAGWLPAQTVVESGDLPLLSNPAKE